jgi:hypothetical protein
VAGGLPGGVTKPLSPVEKARRRAERAGRPCAEPKRSLGWGERLDIGSAVANELNRATISVVRADVIAMQAMFKVWDPHGNWRMLVRL